MYLAVKGYKSICDKRAVAINGLTILSGANSSGKSSFMQPFLLIKQTVESHYDAKVISLEGDNVKLTDSSQVLSKVPNAPSSSFNVYYGDEKESIDIEFIYSKNTGFSANRITVENEKEYPAGLEIKKGMTEKEIESQIPNADLLQVKKYFQEKHSKNFKLCVERNKCFLKIRLKDSEGPYGFNASIEPSSDFEKMIAKLIHVPGLRGNPERSYRVSYADSVFPGSFEKYVAGIISNWKSGKYRHAKFEKLVKNLSDLGLASGIDTSKVNDTRIEIKVSRFSNCAAEHDKVNIADVGFGVSQTLPVLVALLAANRGQLVYIEQPELHLHPKAQYRLAMIIADAVKRGVLVVIETHSSILIRGVQTLVAKGELDNNLVSLNWFQQNPSNGQAEVTAATLDELGAFGDWPEDFDDTSLMADEKYLDAVEKAVYEKNK